MSRKIIIDKYEGNTHWSIHVIDSYGTEHHLGYQSELNNSVMLVIEAESRSIWKNEVKPKEDLMDKAIKNCIEIDKKSGVEPKLD